MSRTKIILVITACLLIIAVVMFTRKGGSGNTPSTDVIKPALTVTTVTPEQSVWPEHLVATGSVQAWQEAIIGSESNGLRLAEVLANVGDHVKKGALLARFADEMVRNGVLQQQAAYDEAKARFAEAKNNADHAGQIRESGALSEQEVRQFTTGAQSAEAQMKLAEARLEAEKIRLVYTRVTAPDDGVISSRSATVGAVTPAGAELFRMIRRGKLEWRAEMAEQQMRLIHTGQPVKLQLSNGESVDGEVTRFSPVIDAQTRNGMIYVDLRPTPSLKAGMFAQGEFELGQTSALTLPQSAVIVSDGFSYVYQVRKDNRVEQIKVSTGRRQGDRIAIIGGVKPNAAVVAAGAGFLNDGDVVRVENAGVRKQ